MLGHADHDEGDHRRARGLLRDAVVPLATVLAALAAAACSRFETAGADGCIAPTCEGAGPSCRSYDFAGPTCPLDWEFSGNTDLPGVVGDCQSGKLHLAAIDTLDVIATLGLGTPDVEYSMLVSARVAVRDWDGGSVLRLDVAGSSPFALSAEMPPSGNPRFLLCDTGGCPATFDSTPGAEHLFQFDVTPTGTTATVDCQAFGTTPAVPLATTAFVTLAFGKVDASPIDGTLDDVVVSFR
jgi:hypothetical protein